MKKIEDYLKLRYKMLVTPDSDEGGFVISFPDLPGCFSSGETLESAIKNAEEAKHAWLEAAIEDGIQINLPETETKYSGQFKIRMPKSLHKSLAEHSKKEGISMNQYCLYLLSKNDAMEAK